MQLIKVWALVSFFGVLKAENSGWSTNMLNFLSLVNGRFINAVQVAHENGRQHDVIQSMSKPVDVPILRPNPVIFAEEAVNGKVNLAQLGVISEGPDNVINVHMYNFIKNLDYKPGTFDFNVLQNLTQEDLETDPNCVSSFEPVGERAYFGNWAICKYTIQGTHPSYPLLFSCDGAVASIPVGVKETYNIVPYVFTLLERIMQLIKAWAFVGFIVVLNAEDPGWSTNVLNFLSVFPGRYINSVQVVHENGKKHDIIQALIKQVDVPILRPNPVVLVEEASNGKVNLLRLGIVSEGPDKVMNVRMFNFTKNLDYPPGTLNLDILWNLTEADLETDPNCVASFVPIGERTFFGNFAICRYTIHGMHPSYPLVFSCDGVASSVPIDVRESYNIVPYVFTILERFPLINAPEDYVSPCEKSAQPCTKNQE